jgi:baculoviral IAP repeat-containing protein 6
LAQRYIRIQLQQEQQIASHSSISVLSCTPAVSNVIYELCTAPNVANLSSASILVQWLNRAAQRQQTSVSASMVHCAAAVLWLNCPSLDLQLIASLFDWTKSILHLTQLKAAVDYTLCSLCRHSPAGYGHLLQLASDSSSLLDRPLVLQTLARAAQSLIALDQLVLHPAGILSMVSRTIGEFSLAVLEGRFDCAGKLTQRMVSALDFWTALCDEWCCSGAGRDVLASYLDREEPLLLQLLLQALCSFRPSTGGANRHDRIEDSTITFLRQFCWTHADNSKNLANILLGVLQPSNSSARPLMTGFTRRLLLQLLLEPEKLYLHVHITAPGASPSAQHQQVVHHPAFGHGKKHQLLYISAETTFTELVRLINGGNCYCLLKFSSMILYIFQLFFRCFRLADG